MDGIEDTTEKGGKDERKLLSENLVDKKNPEMITFMIANEVDDVTLMQTIGQDIDTRRTQLKLPTTSFLTSFIQNNLVLRTSIQGKRSVQLIDAIRGNLSSDDNRNMGLNAIQKRILGSG
jgi:hypothetical protein